jgi:N-formylmaleamate deformylase
MQTTGSRFLYGANVQANGIRQHYLRYGGVGATLILVPGITSPAITWGFVAERLAERFDVYVLDVRGRGLSQAGPGLDYGIDVCADDISGFCAALSLAAPMALGHSMGARHLIRAAARGGIFDRLLLIDPPVSGPGRRAYPAKLAWYLDSMALACAGIDAEGLRVFSPTWTEEQRCLRAAWLHTCDERAVIASFKGFSDDDIHADLPRVAVPTVLVAAEQGGVIGEADVEEIHRLNPKIAAVRVAGAGHMIPWDNLEGFLAALEPYLGAASGEHFVSAVTAGS